MTLNIISGMPRLELIKASVKVIDFMWWVNQTYKAPELQIAEKEFFNEQVNKNLNLNSHLIDWAKRAHVRIRNEYQINTDSRSFNIFDYRWILTLKNRVNMLTKYY